MEDVTRFEEKIQLSKLRGNVVNQANTAHIHGSICTWRLCLSSLSLPIPRHSQVHRTPLSTSGIRKHYVADDYLGWSLALIGRLAFLLLNSEFHSLFIIQSVEAMQLTYIFQATRPSRSLHVSFCFGPVDFLISSVHCLACLPRD